MKKSRCVYLVHGLVHGLVRGLVRGLVPGLVPGLLLTTILLLGLDRVAQADEYQDQLSRAAQMLQENRPAEALKAYQAAYAVQQMPMLFLYMARLNVQLGNGQEALEAYRRFLVAVVNPDAASRQEAEQQIARLSPLVETRSQSFPTGPLQPSVNLQQVEALIALRTGDNETARLRKRNTSLMAGGAVMFGFGYAAAFLTGTLLLGADCCSDAYSSSSGSARAWQAANGILIVPIVGPFVAALIEPSVYWSIPWIFIDGAAQVGGLAMMIMAAKSNHALSKKSGVADLHLLPYTSSRQTGLTLAGRF